MRVEEFTRKNVVFIGIESAGHFTPLGTGCLGGVHVDGLDFMWLATANHVVDAVANPDIFVRVNRKSGGCETVRLAKVTAVRSVACDLALFQVSFGSDVYDQWSIRFSRDEMKSAREKWTPNIGDEITAVGLYTSHYGQEKNIPVGRVGHIAMMPGEPVMAETGYVEAYLIEIKSIAGLSGSPVYVNVPRVRVDEGKLRYLDAPIFDFLGILVGYHVVESKEDQISVPQFQTQARSTSTADEARSYDERNTGFAVVIPFERILEVLESEPIVSSMKLARDLHFKSGGYRPAAASTGPAEALRPSREVPST